MKDEKKMKMKKIGNYNDLKNIADIIDSDIDRYSSVKGEITVFPKKNYVVNSREDLDRIKNNIDLYSSRYASIKGVLTFSDDN